MIMERDMKFKASIRCLTYNHVNYITDALNGFISQETDFPFIALVIDDASTDGEQELLKDFIEHNFKSGEEADFKVEEKEDASVYYGQSVSNPNCFFKFVLLKYNYYSRGKSKMAVYHVESEYEAICEGDDYWTDPLKLQKQVSFLDSHPDYGMCYSSFDIYYQDKGKMVKDLFRTDPVRFPSHYSLEDFILKAGYVAPPSWCVRTEARSCIPNHRFGSPDGTFVMFACFLASSKVYVFPESMVVYRVLRESASHTFDYKKEYLRNSRLLETKLKMISAFGLPEDLGQKCKESYYKISLPKFIANGKWQDVDDAQECIVGKSLRDKVLLSIPRNSFGKTLMSSVYLLKSLLK